VAEGAGLEALGDMHSAGWAAERLVHGLSVTARDALEPLSDTQSDLSRLGWDVADGVGADLYRLVVSQGSRDQDAPIDEVTRDRLERYPGKTGSPTQGPG
jgi:hypothetical protein